MICQRCRSGILSRLHRQHAVGWSVPSSARQLPLQRTQFRNYSDGNASTPPPPQPKGGIAPASASSSATPGASQPPSTPEGEHTKAAPENPTKPAPERPLSSCPAGTKLTGLNFFKNKPDLFALDDSEYPDWLWTLKAEAKNQPNAASGGIDLSHLNKKQRRRFERRQAARVSHLPPQVPAHHQATDITAAQYNQGERGGGDSVAQATEGIEKRTDITKSAREARRKGIREANFLKGL